MKRWKCTVCRYIHEGEEAPEKCPVCGAEKVMFIEITEDAAGSTDLKNQQEEAPEKKELSTITQIGRAHV